MRAIIVVVVYVLLGAYFAIKFLASDETYALILATFNLIMARLEMMDADR